MPKTLTLTVNGAERTVQVEPVTTLLSILRDQLRLTGTKEACNVGECGACTVLVRDVPIHACVTLASDVGGPVTTVEGLGELGLLIGGKLAEHGGFQCGFCTPGMVVMIAALLHGQVETEAEIRAGLAGNVCRCTGYSGIVRAVQALASAKRPPHA